jgi:hypothetical protein
MALLGCVTMQAYAIDFVVGDVNVSWDSQIIGGLGLRTESPSCSLVGGSSGVAGCSGNGNAAQWGNGSLGDLNYHKGQLYSEYLKGTTELLLSNPDGYKFMLRDTFIYDQGAANSITPLSSSAEKTVAPNNRLLDLWISKNYAIDGQSGHWRLGNQVLNWGESYFAVGGINATNSLDLQKLLTPGVQIKEAVLPSPMLAVSQGLGMGFSVEAYYQFGWNHHRFPAVGTFWSTSNQYGAGGIPAYTNSTNANVGTYPGDPSAFVTPFGPDRDPKDHGQYGINLHYKPKSAPLDMGFYVLNYHDKMPVIGYDAGSGSSYFDYLSNRKLYGISVNVPLGDFAVGMESSYRPHDAVSLTGCFAGNGGQINANTSTYTGSCQQWKDMKKIQTDIVGQLNMQPSDYPALKKIGADFAVFTIEGTMVSYPGVSNNGLVTSTQGGTTVVQGYDAGYGAWLNGSNISNQTVASVGSANSEGMTVDFNWTYDGSLVPGWQINPGVTFFDALHGNTPNPLGQYLQGQKSLNFYAYFNQNPAVWQAGANYTHYFGGTPVSQPYGDRDNIGLFVTRNF